MNEQGGSSELFLSDDSSSVPTPEAQFELEHEVVDPGSPYSSRIDRMSHQRSLSLSSAIEFDTAFSKEHWAELDPSFALTKEVLTNPEETDRVFNPVDFALGPMLAEGAQAQVFKAYVSSNAAFAVKVFKADSVQALRSTLPANLFACSHPAVCRMIKGVILENQKYAILMEIHLRDLRKAMDVIMEKHSNQGPPFQEPEALFYMLTIACGVHYLHSMGILHRDLKAANVLVRYPLPADYQSKDYPPAGVFRCAVADYECSAGILGSGLWRAPELLHFSKNWRSLGSIEFTTKMDVYGYAMTCYEILTGLVPFERYGKVRSDRVIDGLRPQLPSHLSSGVRDLVSRCWHGDPDARPEFAEIVETLVEMVSKLGFKEEDVEGYHHQKPISTSQMIERRLSSVSSVTSRYVTIEE